MHSKATYFCTPNVILFAQTFLFCPQTPPYSTNQKLSIWTSPSLLFSKACLFCAKSLSIAQTFLIVTQSTPFPPSAALFCPAITYCSPKNSVVLFIFAPNPHAVTPEPRTDSKPFRRRFVRKAGLGSCRRKLFQNYFRQSFESQVAGRSPACFLVTFCTTQKVTIRSLCREHRGFANLDSAHPNNNFAQTQLNPLPLRGNFFLLFVKYKK